jgi:DNA-binding transcriptional ArsR family regulator
MCRVNYQSGEAPKPNRALELAGIPRVKARHCIRALSSPQRRRILRSLHEAGEAQSSKEISKGSDASLGNVTYHVNVLKECGVVALTDTQPKRGAVEHFYASTVIHDKLVAQLLEGTRVEDGD